MSPTPNPYAPSRMLDTERSGSKPRRNLLVEVACAAGTIIGIIAGWVMIGAGLLNGNLVSTLLGCGVIFLACAISLAKPAKRRQER